MNNIFEQATRKKLRFALNGGAETISTEELWELKLADLDKIAVAIDTKLGAEKSQKSFIGKKTKTASSVLTLKLDVLKAIIDVKMEEEEKAKTKSEKKAQIALLEDILAKKQLNKLETSSIASIEKQLAALKSDEDEE